MDEEAVRSTVRSCESEASEEMNNAEIKNGIVEVEGNTGSRVAPRAFI